MQADDDTLLDASIAQRMRLRRPPIKRLAFNWRLKAVAVVIGALLGIAGYAMFDEDTVIVRYVPTERAPIL